MTDPSHREPRRDSPGAGNSSDGRTVVVRGVSVPAIRSGLATERSALREHWGVLDAPFEALIEVTGPDRQSFLQNLLTQDVTSIPLHQTRPAAQAGRRGHIEADLWIQERGESFFVRVAADRAQALLATWDKYRIIEDVDFRLRDEVRAYLLLGPRVPAGEALTAKPGLIACLAGVEISGQDRCLFVSRDRMEHFETALLQMPDPPQPIGWRAFNLERIAAGRAWDGLDFDGDRLVPEAGLDDRIDYRKGCYLGQETLARLHYQGRPNWTLARFQLSAGPPDLSPGQIGVDLFDEEGRRSGWITSWETDDPQRQGFPVVGLGYLHRRVLESNSTVAPANGEFRVHYQAAHPPVSS